MAVENAENNDTQVVDRKDMLAQQFDEAEQASTAPAQEEKPSSERARDESGRFAKTEAERASEQAKPQKQQQAASPNPEPVTEPVDEAWKRPPGSWKKDFHDIYGSLDPKLQAYVHERETQMRAGVENVIPKAKFADEINAVLEPYLPTIRGLGMDAPGAIKGLMEADRLLRTLPAAQKMQYAAQVLGSYGIDLNSLQGQQQQPVMDQNYYTLQNELTRLRGEWASYTQAQQEQQNALLQTEISGFAQKSEHFEQAKPTMIQLLQSGVASTLEEAYEKAIRLDPELFETVAARRQAEEQEKKAAQATAAVNAARKAAVSPRSSTPGVRPVSKAQDRRSMLSEAFDNMSERL